MEVEKCLFKIHERTLGVSCCGGFMRGCFTIFFLICNSFDKILKFHIFLSFIQYWIVSFRKHQIQRQKRRFETYIRPDKS